MPCRVQCKSRSMTRASHREWKSGQGAMIKDNGYPTPIDEVKLGLKAAQVWHAPVLLDESAS